MKLEQSFEVAAPADQVWAALIDPMRVAPCLPGAEITEAAPDGSYRGNFQVKLGPTTAAYRGTLRMASLDEAARVATLDANGTDKRGQGGAKATLVSSLHEADGVTRVDVVTDFTITGRLARFGRSGMIEDISNRLLGEFAACLAARLTAEAESGAGAGDSVGEPALAGGVASPEATPGGTIPTPTSAPAGAPTTSAGPATPAEATPSGSIPPVSGGGAPPTAPLDVGSVLGDLLRERGRQALPALVAALVAVLLVVLLRRGRR